MRTVRAARPKFLSSRKFYITGTNGWNKYRRPLFFEKRKKGYFLVNLWNEGIIPRY